MNSLLLLRSTHLHLLLSLHRKTLTNSILRPFSSSAEPAAEPIDPRTLPTDYDPSTFNPESPNPPPSPRVWRLVDEITALTLADIADLSQILVHKLNLEKPPTIAVMGAGSSAFPGSSASAEKGEGGEKAAAAAEKTVFEIKLESFEAASKIKVIKEVRGFTDLGLKEAKELVEKAPVVVKGGFSKEEGLKIVEKMKAVGAKAVLE